MYTTNRLLPERSYLNFSFRRDPDDIIFIKLPFYENIDISESKKNNIVRNSVLYQEPTLAYTGAQTKKISIKFNLNLDHLRTQLLSPESIGYLEDPLKYSNKSESEKRKFININLNSEKPEKVPYFKTLLSRFVSHPDFISSVATARSSIGNLIDPNYFVSLQSKNAPTDITKITNQLIFWISIIKASTLTKKGNGDDIPIVYFNHGSLYQNVPCVVDRYSLNIKSNVTYQLQTLTPNIIEVSLDLLELSNIDKLFRSTIISSYAGVENTAEVGSDALPSSVGTEQLTFYGWESIIAEPFSADAPFYDEFTAPGSAYDDYVLI